MSRMIVLYLFSIFVLCGLATSTEDPVFSIYQTPENIRYQGYQAETHHVTTQDGYILEMHRIPYRRYSTNTTTDERPVVFLMHGLLSASYAFITLGSEFSIAYNLADAGFDVWMGNARGNKNSRYHVTLDPDDESEKFQFWDFSWEEIGMYDVASMVDYVLEYTGRDWLHYIGHSQGGTVFLVLNSMRPEYNRKFASAHLLAGVGYMQYFPDEEIRNLAQQTGIIYNMALNMGIVELFPPNSTEMIPGFPMDTTPSNRSMRISDNCVGDVSRNYMCELFGVDHIMRTDDLETNVTGQYDMGGAALKQIAHYGQNIRDGTFRRWNYGLFQNLREYGSFNAPAYDLSLITCNVTMHYSLNDSLLDERDVLAMANDMPNTIVRRVARESFLHEDYAAATDARELVTEYIIETMLSVPLSPPEPDVEDPTVDIPDVPETDPDDVPGTNPDDVPGTDPDDVPGTNPDDVPGTDPDDVPGTNPDDVPGTDPDDVPGTDPNDLPSVEPVNTEPSTDSASGLALSSLFNIYLIVYSISSILN